MMSPDIDMIANQLGKAKRVGNGWSCLCPAHDDHNPSFSLSLGKDGTLLARCYAGCSFADIMFALRKRRMLENGELIQRNENDQCASPKPPDEVVLRIWRETLSAEDSPVQAYLKGRGYDGIDFFRNSNFS